MSKEMDKEHIDKVKFRSVIVNRLFKAEEDKYHAEDAEDYRKIAHCKGRIKECEHLLEVLNNWK